MNAIPCVHSLEADMHAARMGEDAAREAEVERLTGELEASYRHDVEILADAFGEVAGTIGDYDKRYRNNHPQSAQFLTDVFNATDDLECMRLIRKGMVEYIRQRAEMDAEAKVWGP